MWARVTAVCGLPMLRSTAAGTHSRAASTRAFPLPPAAPSRPVHAAAGVDAAGSEKALREMEAAGATLVSGEELLRLWAGAGAAEAS